MAGPGPADVNVNDDAGEGLSSLPSEVVTCLRNARFLHLATCHGLEPHVSLMNYTYLPSSPYSRQPTIIMTTDPHSKKTTNLINNPRVALLVHDWVSHRPPTATAAAATGAAAAATPRSTSRLADLLINLNTSALSSISATINGTATVIAAGSDEERYFKAKHLENNTFDDGPVAAAPARLSANGHLPTAIATGPDPSLDEGRGDGGRNCYIEGDQVRVVAVRIVDGRIADWKGRVRDWSLRGARASVNGSGGGGGVGNGTENGNGVSDRPA
ncbi:MAG: hypothetical protein M1826_001656 [Phylliscum demangeonii]|nr:MAG: hypothetical protein M1826_001656 [Phylliscum demangeonii]